MNGMIGKDGEAVLFARDSATGKKVAVASPGDSFGAYFCGLTPWSPSHVGHARSFAVADLFLRLSRMAGADVAMARNVTDVDDKTIAAGVATGEGWEGVAARHAGEADRLSTAMGLLPVLSPKASEHIGGVAEMALRLVSMGFAYRSSTGDINFDSTRSSGTLARHAPGALRGDSGAGRVDAAGKRDPRDFALWKASSPDEPGWETQAGRGRPGWHSECVAMILSLFPGGVGVHGGGSDLKFPHHAAEEAQGRALVGDSFVGSWIHNGSVLAADGTKMSKSAGNQVSWAEAFDAAAADAPGFAGDALRIALLSPLWSKPAPWRGTGAAAAWALHIAGGEGSAPGDREALVGALMDNMNFPMFMTEAANQRSKGRGGAALDILSGLGFDPLSWELERVPDEVLRLGAAREGLRAAGDWAGADAAREGLRKVGWEPNDMPGGRTVFTRRT